MYLKALKVSFPFLCASLITAMLLVFVWTTRAQDILKEKTPRPPEIDAKVILDQGVTPEIRLPHELIALAKKASAVLDEVKGEIKGIKELVWFDGFWRGTISVAVLGLVILGTSSLFPHEPRGNSRPQPPA